MPSHLAIRIGLLSLFLSGFSNCASGSLDRGVDKRIDGAVGWIDSAIPAGSPDAGAFPSCVELTATAEARYASDIVLVLSTAGKSRAFVSSQLNAWASKILSATDAHVALVSDEDPTHTSFQGYCVPAPLGSGNCPDDTKLPSYLHYPFTVAYGDGPASFIDVQTKPNIIAAYGEKIIRYEAAKHVVFLETKESTMPAATFLAKLAGLGARWAGTRVHIIAPFDHTSAACQAALGANGSTGTEFRAMAATTGGVEADYCTQDFAAVFDEISKRILANPALACQWTIPPMPNGKELDPSRLNLTFTGDGPAEPLGRTKQADCERVPDGWYVDNETAPKTVRVCDQTCDRIRRFPKGKVDIKFGCLSSWVVY